MKIYTDGCTGLIVCFQTGVKYASQTGGMSCNQPEVEGFWVPGLMFQDGSPHMEKVHDLLCWGGGLGDQAWTEDELLKIANGISSENHHLQLDRSRLSILEEAWIPVVIVGPFDQYDDLRHCEGLPGIFTYNNCD